MATYAAEGVNYANYNSTPQKMVGVDEWGGRLRVMYDSYTETAAGDAGSTIKLGRLPAKARVWAAHIKTDTSFSTAKLAVAAGDATLRAAAVLTATTWQDMNEGMGTSVGDSAADVVVTTSVAATPGTAALEIAVFYTVD